MGNPKHPNPATAKPRARPHMVSVHMTRAERDTLFALTRARNSESTAALIRQLVAEASVAPTKEGDPPLHDPKTCDDCRSCGPCPALEARLR